MPHAAPEERALVKSVSPSGVSARIVLLLAAALFINYVDRGNLSTAAPLLQSELHLSNTQIGVLLSAFFWTYAPLQLLAGWMAERLDVHKVLPAGLALWSLATVLTGVAGSFLVLLGLRLLLGLGRVSYIRATQNFWDFAPQRISAARPMASLPLVRHSARRSAP